MAKRKNFAFQWTAEEWAILEPLSEADRVELCMRAMFQGRTLLKQAAHEELTQGGRAVRHSGFFPDAGDSR